MLQTICQKTPKESIQYEDCKKALQAVSKVRVTPPTRGKYCQLTNESTTFVLPCCFCTFGQLRQYCVCNDHYVNFKVNTMTNGRACVCEQVVRKCNEGARTMERTEMMYTINSQLEFKIKV